MPNTPRIPPDAMLADGALPPRRPGPGVSPVRADLGEQHAGPAAAAEGGEEAAGALDAERAAVKGDGRLPRGDDAGDLGGGAPPAAGEIPVHDDRIWHVLPPAEDGGLLTR